MNPPHKPDSRAGVAQAASAYVLWGLVVMYWKPLAVVGAWEVLAHRVIWSVVFVAILAAFLARWKPILAALRNRRALTALFVSTLLIAGNWGLFIWAVMEGRIVETSLGYFINPLLSILLGVVILGERLTTLRLVAVSIAAGAVIYQTIALGELPWISLTLASSFAVYGYVRKVVKVEALDGLFVETLLVLPFALAYLVSIETDGSAAFLNDGLLYDLLLIGCGPITAIPLWLFALGARSIRLSTLGFLQYIAPTISLVIAVFLYDEPFSGARALSFGLIWLALALVSLDAILSERRGQAPAGVVEPEP